LQQNWISQYQQDDGQAYFMICDKAGQKIGTVRLYDAIGDSFCWGSWIVDSAAPAYVAVESALMVYAYATDHLGFSRAHFDVRRDNTRVRAFHERFGARQTGETSGDILFEISAVEIDGSRRKYARYLPNAIKVISNVNL
jgi:RimJ/RimL family protein N-acetyltransferase